MTLFSLAFVLLVTPSPALAGDAVYNPPLEVLMADIMKSDPSPSTVDQVFWFPTEFWQFAMMGNPDVSPSQAEQLVGVLEPYTMFAVIEGDMGPMGAVRFHPEADVRAGLSLRLPNGETVRPLPNNEVAGDAVMLVNVMKPMFSAMLGPTGEHLEFFFFANRDAKGKPIIDPRSNASFTVNVGETPYVWQLPLESLFEPQPCGKCARMMKGTWSYCPYDGTPAPKRR